MVIPERRKVGKYEILRKLGRGGMADVYLAQDIYHERIVAIKVIEQGQAGCRLPRNHRSRASRRPVAG